MRIAAHTHLSVTLLRLAVTAGVALPACAQVNVLTANYDKYRTDANLQETILQPSNVNAQSFGKIGTFPVDGQIYAQPLYVSGVEIAGSKHDVVYVATMHNSVYAIDAGNPQSTTPLWQVNFGPTVPIGMFNFTDIVPEIGILGTPVIDLTEQALYVVSDTLPDGSSQPVFQLHALSLADGHEILNGPVTIAASVPGTGAGSSQGAVAFDAFQQLQRPGLVRANGCITVAFGSHDDSGAYHGWLISYDQTNLQHRIAVFNTSPNGLGAAIWQAGRAPAFDDQGDLYISTGNGDYDGKSNFGEAAMHLSGVLLKLLDWYTPNEWPSLNVEDYDLGSSGPILVPGTNLLLAGGKNGILYLIQRDSMGHLGPDTTSTVQGVQVNASGLGIYTFALWDKPSGPIVYEYAILTSLKAFQITNGRLNPTPLSQYTPAVGYSEYAGLAVSANGGQAGTGIVWLTTGDNTVNGVPGTLHALDASDVSHELWNSDLAGPRDRLGRLAKFVAPTVANGRVYVPTFSNTLAIYGPLSSNSTPATSPSQITAVVSGASFLSTPVAPGEVVTIFGVNLGPSAPVDGQVDATNHVLSSLSDTQVLFDGLPAPLIYASSTQLNAVVPFGVSGSSTQVQVMHQGQVASSMTVPVQAAAPAFFSLDRTGGGPGAILNQDGTLNSQNNPAARGSVVVLYGTGGGQTDPAGADGLLTSGPPYPLLSLPVTVFIDGLQADVLYAGAAPGLIAGVMQINVRVPATATVFKADQITIQVGDYMSPSAVTLAVQ